MKNLMTTKAWFTRTAFTGLFVASIALLGTALFANHLINSNTTVVKTTPNVDAVEVIVQHLDGKDGLEKDQMLDGKNKNTLNGKTDGNPLGKIDGNPLGGKQDFGGLGNSEKLNTPILDKDDLLEKQNFGELGYPEKLNSPILDKENALEKQDFGEFGNLNKMDTPILDKANDLDKNMGLGINIL
jgi:hypothetical protein